MAKSAKSSPPGKLRYSVSLVRQGKKQFYTLTLPSDVLGRTCIVSSREEDPINGFQRTLDTKRAEEIAKYIDSGLGTIPSSIVLSAQSAAKLKIVGAGKTMEFSDTPKAFLVLDGQHRVYGFSKAKTHLRVPVVIYNNLTRAEESQLFIDINTKQRPVPNALLLDIKSLANIETADESVLREVFDQFDKRSDSAMHGLTSRSKTITNKINRVTFNSSVKPLLTQLSERSPNEIYEILNNYLSAISVIIADKAPPQALAKPVLFRAFMGLFPSITTRVKDKFGGEYSIGNFDTVASPIFHHFPKARLANPGQSWVALRDYMEKRMVSKTTF